MLTLVRCIVSVCVCHQNPLRIFETGVRFSCHVISRFLIDSVVAKILQVAGLRLN